MDENVKHSYITMEELEHGSFEESKLNRVPKQDKPKAQEECKKNNDNDDDDPLPPKKNPPGG